MSDAPAIEARRVGFSFPDGREALADLSLSVRPGESVGVVGPNGAGKTTFFLCLIGIHRPSRGGLRVLDLDVADRGALGEIRRRIGLVFQRPDDQLFSARVYDDVAFGPLNLGLSQEEVRRRTDAALARTQCTEHAERVSHHLSAGEKRRVALACVLAMEPEVLVLDEPTNDLDPRSRRSLAALVGSLRQTRLIASHDLEFILQSCGRAIVLDGGRVVADGPVREVLANARTMQDHGLEVPPSLAR